MKFPNADLVLQFPMWRHMPQYKHHKGQWDDLSSLREAFDSPVL
jgi:hypothetical protein